MREEFAVKAGIRLFGIEIVGLTLDKTTAQASASEAVDVLSSKVRSVINSAASQVAERTAASGEQTVLEVHLPE